VAPAADGPAQGVTSGVSRQVRVSVKVSVRDPNLIVARPLADGQEAPAGTREALLVLVDASGDPLAGPHSAGVAR
jgi:hypothetical protein